MITSNQEWCMTWFKQQNILAEVDGNKIKVYRDSMVTVFGHFGGEEGAYKHTLHALNEEIGLDARPHWALRNDDWLWLDFIEPTL